MEAKMIQRQGMILVGMACDVTLEDVQKRVTINLAEQFMARKSEINNIINTREYLDCLQIRRIIIPIRINLNTLSGLRFPQRILV
jgi:hypothetical protein